jgi:hypothetical protein
MKIITQLLRGKVQRSVGKLVSSFEIHATATTKARNASAGVGKAFLVIDWYQRHAISRRKFAIRAWMKWSS